MGNMSRSHASPHLNILNTLEDVGIYLNRRRVYRIFILFHTMVVNGYCKLFGCQHYSEYLIVLNRIKKHTDLEQVNIQVNDDGIFLVNPPFKSNGKTYSMFACLMK